MLLGGNVLKYRNLTLLDFLDLEIDFFLVIFHLDSNLFIGSAQKMEVKVIFRLPYNYITSTYMCQEQNTYKVKIAILFRQEKVNTHRWESSVKSSFPLDVC